MKQFFAPLLNTRGKRMAAGTACILLIAVLLGIMAFRYITAPSVSNNSSPASAEEFLKNTPEKDLKKIIADVDFLTVQRSLNSFENVSALTMSDIFNLYASTREVQDRMKGGAVDDVELFPAELEAFFTRCFGDYPFDLDKLVAEKSGILRYKNDKTKDILLLSSINGGVFWPSPFNSELTLDSFEPDGDRLTINAARHYYEESAVVDETWKITLTLRITEDGFNYVSWSQRQVPVQETLRGKYYDYFVTHPRQINPLFAVPGSDPASLDANLMIFALQDPTLEYSKNGASREEINNILNKYFGRTVDNYVTPYSQGLASGKIAPTGWSFHGSNRLVLTQLSKDLDGSFTGVFNVYYIPEGEGDLAAIDEALRMGNSSAYQVYFAQTVTMNWNEIEDKAEPLGFYIRYNSIVTRVPQDWGVIRGGIPAYFMVDGSFVGAYEGGQWVSLVDPHAQSYTRDSFHPFLIKDLLNRGYALYSRDKSLGQAKEAAINTGLGPGGFDDGDKTELFAPFAKKAGNGLCTFDLPVLLSGGELDTLAVPDFGFSVYMGTDLDTEGRFNKPALATNASIPPPDGILWSDSISPEDEAALQKVLTDNSAVYGNPDVTAATGDFDSDGKPETVLFANIRDNPEGYLDIGPENKTLFSVILLHDGDSYQTVYSRFMPYTEDITSYFRTLPVGVFDLNGDGIHEICAQTVGWESGSTFVLSRNVQGVWEQVLLALWGT